MTNKEKEILNAFWSFLGLSCLILISFLDGRLFGGLWTIGTIEKSAENVQDTFATSTCTLEYVSLKKNWRSSNRSSKNCINVRVTKVLKCISLNKYFFRVAKIDLSLRLVRVHFYGIFWLPIWNETMIWPESRRFVYAIRLINIQKGFFKPIVSMTRCPWSQIVSLLSFTDGTTTYNQFSLF